MDTKIRDVVGLYLRPPEKAVVVVCIDEKSQIQALDRTAPTLPIRLGVPERQTHDYVRHATTTLFAALEVATGRVEQLCQPRHRHQEFLRFLTQVATAYPRRKLHVVCDNYATHKHPAVKAWLARNPRISLHFTPTSGSWLNMVEIFFGIITRQAIRPRDLHLGARPDRGHHRIHEGWNERCQPFVWTKDADTIIAKAHRKSNSGTRHYGHTKIAGKQVLRKGLSPLATTISTAQSAPVIAGMRLRAGKTGSGKGAGRPGRAGRFWSAVTPPMAAARWCAPAGAATSSSPWS